MKNLTLSVIDKDTKETVMEVDILGYNFSFNQGYGNTTVDVSATGFFRTKESEITFKNNLFSHFSKMNCTHAFETYQGLEESYTFCTKCGTKK